MEPPSMGLSGQKDDIGTSNQYDRYEPQFREHYEQTYAGRGGAYEDYEKAYRHGCDLAADPNCQGKAWSEVRPYARQKWEAQHPENFEDYEQAVGEGYAAVGGL